ncbi:magnesium chelatase [Streptomyces sp. KM273126]|uniref:magnesium chelatase n=1 Tax=Streptomyces sp. KM273126 TaxID=2545247 RepID=UPI00215D8AB7|nr:magnesium chelatase [Streptomyces sp. KM273126]
MSGIVPADPASGSDTSAVGTVPEEPDDLALRLVRALVCAAVEPALGGVLLFDLEPRLIDPVARLFAGILTGEGQPADTPLVLGATSRDEDLWTRPRLRQGPDGLSFRIEPGPLIRADGRPGAPPLAVVPDLTRLSVAGMRAAVQLVGADLVVVEHTGLSHAARPRTRWLAACRSSDAGRLSPHLLDRFAVRLSAAGLNLPPAHRLLGRLPPAWLTAATQGVPVATVTDDALERVQELLGRDTSAPGIRRELALARLARTLAALDGEGTATGRHCDAAARLIGLAVAESAQPAETAVGPETSPPLLPRRGPLPDDGHRDRGGRADEDARPRREPGEPLLETEPAEGIGTFPGGAPEALAGPFPEDGAAVLRDFAPLSSPWQRTAGPAAARGVVIGTRRARDLHDLAYVRTVREAAVHQRLRRTERFTISPVDLHSHVRASAPERMLVLVLDHTCRGDDWDWQDALTPFLQWAYTGRAATQVVEVGVAEPADELRAESFAARSVLDPRVLAALYRPAGHATPLAHGIEQAAQALRRAFRQQGNGLAEAWLVVVTDGRGNVPLRVSHTGRVSGPVAAEGVEDAFKAAARISAMDRTRLHVTVVDAAREPYGDLPFALADRLGGSVVEGRAARGRGPNGEGGTVER